MFEQPNTESIAILIDCWTDVNSDLIQNIKNYCVDNTSIKAIFLNSYARLSDNLSKDEPYWSNSNSIFNLETKFDELRNQWKNALFEHITTTHKDLLKPWTRPDQNLFSAFSSLQILYYCNYINPAVDKIYFFGEAWDICVKYRPTGWMQINALNYHNLFHTKKMLLSRPECVANSSHQILTEFEHGWQRLPNGDYQLTEDIW
jgi:hypothetical protein